MPIIRSHNAHFFRFEAELDYTDLPNSVVRGSIAYGSFAPELFIDVNSPAIEALIETQDQRLFEVLTALRCEAKRLLEEQLTEEKHQQTESKQIRETQVALRLKRPGYVYLVKAGQYFKIGRSKQPNVRFEQIGLQLPFPFEVLHVIPVTDMYEAEKQLHSKYAHRHLNGEWFELSENEVVEITSLESL